MAAAMRDLQGAWNFRDVADSTGVLRPGRLFRSSELSRLDDGGRDELRRLGITDVADLRSPREVRAPRTGPGARWRRHPPAAHPRPRRDETVPTARWRRHARACLQQLMTDKPDDESVNEAAAAT